MKKFLATLIVIVVLAVVGCGTSGGNSTQSADSSADIEEIRQLLGELKATQDEISSTVSEVNGTVNDVQASIDEVNSGITRNNALIEGSISKQNNPGSSSSETSETSETSEASNGKLQVSCCYNEKFFAINLFAEADKKNCLEDLDTLPYTGRSPKRDVIFLLSSEAKHVYWINEEFKVIEELDYTFVNDTKCVFFNMKNGGGNYYFQVDVSNGESYFFSVYY